MPIFSRSWQGLNLSPGERAFLKLFEGWLVTAIGAGVAIAAQMLVTGSTDYYKIFLVSGGAAGITLYNAVKKYLAAQSDIPLPTASLATQATEVASQETQKIAAQLAPPMPQAQPRFTTPVPQPQFVQAAPFPYQPSSTYPQMPAMQGQ